MNILLTGFGPFPGAPFNPTDAGRGASAQPSPRLAGVRRIAHVFRTSYETVDRELPELIAREQARCADHVRARHRTRHLRIETRARNTSSRIVPDAAGQRPRAGTIAPGAAATLALRIPAQRLVKAARSTGVRAVLSRDAGTLSLQLSVLARDRGGGAPNGPRSRPSFTCRWSRDRRSRRAPLTFDHLSAPAKRSCWQRSPRRAPPVNRHCVTKLQGFRAVALRHMATWRRVAAAS